MEIEISPAEARVLPLLKKGLTNKAIATELKISQRTVETHISNMYSYAYVGSRISFIYWLESNSVKMKAKYESELKPELDFSKSSFEVVTSAPKILCWFWGA